jgi:hypothetical protein
MSITGFYLGVKTVDYFFYKDEAYMLLRENLEDEYWTKNGKIKNKANLPKYLPIWYRPAKTKTS